MNPRHTFGLAWASFGLLLAVYGLDLLAATPTSIGRVIAGLVVMVTGGFFTLVGVVLIQGFHG